VSRVRCQVTACGVCSGRDGSGMDILRLLRFPLPVFIPQTAPRPLINLSSTLYVLDTDSVVKQHTCLSAYFQRVTGQDKPKTQGFLNNCWSRWRNWIGNLKISEFSVIDVKNGDNPNFREHFERVVIAMDSTTGVWFLVRVRFFSTAPNRLWGPPGLLSSWYQRLFCACVNSI
jgi:hypothetical protein